MGGRRISVNSENRHLHDTRYTEYFAQRRCFAWLVLGGGPHASVALASSG